MSAPGPRRRTTLALLVAAALLGSSALVACDDDPVTAPDPTPTAVPVRAPAVKACYRLDVAAGLELSNASPRVPCNQRHTAVTVAVGRVKARIGGKAVTVESAPAQQQIAGACKAAVDRHVGGSRETRRLSRVQAVWFSPDPEQLAAGARWYRCDLVIAGSKSAFTPLPARTRGLLARTSSLDRYGTCGTSAPGTTGFRRVVCSAPHRWRARASIDLPDGATYLGRSAGKVADATCRDVEVLRAETLSRLRWSFEWPTRAQWTHGQRYGLCWTPR